jgi:hypothetical protein
MTSRVKLNFKVLGVQVSCSLDLIEQEKQNKFSLIYIHLDIQ